MNEGIGFPECLEIQKSKTTYLFEYFYSTLRSMSIFWEQQMSFNEM